MFLKQNSGILKSRNSVLNITAKKTYLIDIVTHYSRMHTGSLLDRNLTTLPMAGIQHIVIFVIFEEKRHSLGLPTQFQRINRS